ncbi:hypothetical protein QYF36_003833 [Acer negundo]|nr:hypothetical protein QYF36_003833 [Acer negundo]
MESDKWNQDVNWGAYNEKEDGTTSAGMSDWFEDRRSRKRSFVDTVEEFMDLKGGVKEVGGKEKGHKVLVKGTTCPSFSGFESQDQELVGEKIGLPLMNRER